MPSFDVVSELDSHEVTNAVDQANRELSQRFDFKDTGAVFELNGLTVAVKAQVEFQLKQMLEILKLRLAKRGHRCHVPGDQGSGGESGGRGAGGDTAPGNRCRYRAPDRAPDQGLEDQGAGQRSGREGAHHRKQRDDLQSAMALLRKAKVEMPRCSSTISATEAHQRSRAIWIWAQRLAVASTTLGPSRLKAWS